MGRNWDRDSVVRISGRAPKKFSSGRNLGNLHVVSTENLISPPKSKETASDITKKLAAKVKKKTLLAQKRSFKRYKSVFQKNKNKESGKSCVRPMGQSKGKYARKKRQSGITKKLAAKIKKKSALAQQRKKILKGISGKYLKRRRLCKKQRIRNVKRAAKLAQEPVNYDLYNPGLDERKPCLVEVKVDDLNLEEVSDVPLDEADFEEVEVASMEDMSKSGEIPVGFRKYKKKYLRYKRVSFFRPKIFLMSPDRTIINCLNFCEQSEEIDVISEAEYEAELEVSKNNSENVKANEVESKSDCMVDSQQQNITVGIDSAKNGCTNESSRISLELSSELGGKFQHCSELHSDSEFYQGKSVIQSYLENWKSHLIGLEYLIEIRNNLSDNFAMKYHCVLCDEDLPLNGDFSEIVISHITHFKHATKYLEKHFPSCGYKLSKSLGSNASELVLQKCCEEINSKCGYNFMCITNCNFYKSHKQKLEERINNAVHFNEVNHLHVVKLQHIIDSSVCSESVHLINDIISKIVHQEQSNVSKNEIDCKTFPSKHGFSKTDSRSIHDAKTAKNKLHVAKHNNSTNLKIIDVNVTKKNKTEPLSVKEKIISGEKCEIEASHSKQEKEFIVKSKLESAAKKVDNLGKCLPDSGNAIQGLSKHISIAKDKSDTTISVVPPVALKSKRKPLSSYMRLKLAVESNAKQTNTKLRNNKESETESVKKPLSSKSCEKNLKAEKINNFDAKSAIKFSSEKNYKQSRKMKDKNESITKLRTKSTSGKAREKVVETEQKFDSSTKSSQPALDKVDRKTVKNEKENISGGQLTSKLTSDKVCKVVTKGGKKDYSNIESLTPNKVYKKTVKCENRDDTNASSIKLVAGNEVVKSEKKNDPGAALASEFACDENYDQNALTNRKVTKLEESSESITVIVSSFNKTDLGKKIFLRKSTKGKSHQKASVHSKYCIKRILGKDSSLKIPTTSKSNVVNIEPQDATLNVTNNSVSNSDNKVRNVTKKPEKDSGDSEQQKTVSSEQSSHDDPQAFPIKVKGPLRKTIPRWNVTSPSKRLSRSPFRKQSSSSFASSFSGSSIRNHSRSPVRRYSRSPVRRHSRSPIRRRSRSTVRRRSRSPIRRHSRSPIRRHSRSPIHRRSRSPVRRRSRSPSSRSPMRRIRSPLRRNRSPFRRIKSPTTNRARSPASNRARSPTSNRVRSPTNNRARSPTTNRARSPLRMHPRDPSSRHNLLPVSINSTRRFSRSSPRKVSRSPIRRYSRSPSKRHSRSPYRRHSRSPLRKSSRSPVRRYTRSPLHHIPKSPHWKMTNSNDKAISRSSVDQSAGSFILHSGSPVRKNALNLHRENSPSLIPGISRSPLGRYEKSDIHGSGEYSGQMSFHKNLNPQENFPNTSIYSHPHMFETRQSRPVSDLDSISDEDESVYFNAMEKHQRSVGDKQAADSRILLTQMMQKFSSGIVNPDNPSMHKITQFMNAHETEIREFIGSPMVSGNSTNTQQIQPEHVKNAFLQQHLLSNLAGKPFSQQPVSTAPTPFSPSVFQQDVGHQGFPPSSNIMPSPLSNPNQQMYSGYPPNQPHVSPEQFSSFQQQNVHIPSKMKVPSEVMFKDLKATVFKLFGPSEISGKGASEKPVAHGYVTEPDPDKWDFRHPDASKFNVISGPKNIFNVPKKDTDFREISDSSGTVRDNSSMAFSEKHGHFYNSNVSIARSDKPAITVPPPDAKVSFCEMPRASSKRNLFPVVGGTRSSANFNAPSSQTGVNDMKISLAQRLASVLVKVGMIDVPAPLLQEMLMKIGAFSSCPPQDIREGEIISILKKLGYLA